MMPITHVYSDYDFKDKLRQEIASHSRHDRLYIRGLSIFIDPETPFEQFADHLHRLVKKLLSRPNAGTRIYITAISRLKLNNGNLSCHINTSDNLFGFDPDPKTFEFLTMAQKIITCITQPAFQKSYCTVFAYDFQGYLILP